MFGGALGCVIRWMLSIKLNSSFPLLPPGTLLVNLLGGFMIGAAVAFFIRYPFIDPGWRLFIITGLCGGMTTFSTFSSEVVTALQAGNIFWAFISIFLHVSGSLAMTALGYMLIISI